MVQITLEKRAIRWSEIKHALEGAAAGVRWGEDHPSLGSAGAALWDPAHEEHTLQNRASLLELHETEHSARKRLRSGKGEWIS